MRRRLQHRYDHVNARIHILDGYLIAYLNIDEVIRIIRREDEPKPVLMKRFKLSELQAEAILELKLRFLNKLAGDGDPRRAGQARRPSAPTSKKSSDRRTRLRKQVRDELEKDGEEFGDRRRSPIVEREAAKALDADGADSVRAGDGGAVGARLGARGQGTRSRSDDAAVQVGRCVPARGDAGAAISSRCSSTRWAARTRCRRTSCRRRRVTASR